MADVAGTPLSIKIADAILFAFFLLMSTLGPLLDIQMCLPPRIIPKCLVHLMDWYVEEYGDYLKIEKPDFFVGAVWVVILFHWPLAIASMVGIIGSKSWYPTTCLMYGVSLLSLLAPIVGDMIGSGKASDKMSKVYLSLFGPAVIAIIRGLIPNSSSIPSKKNNTKLA